MNIYLAHSTKFDYKNELYAPIRESHLVDTHNFIFLPEDPKTFDSSTVIKSGGCDLIIAEVSYPSTGSGIELGWAEHLGVPIIFIYKQGATYSGYLKTISDRFFEYKEPEQIPDIINSYILSWEEANKQILKKIYVGCALTQAPEAYRRQIESFKNDLRSIATVLDFVGLVNGNPKEVFEWDTKCVKSCDLFIADCTYPAIGLGYELGVALELRKRILAIAEEDAKISRLVLGVTSPKYQFVRYKNLSEIFPQVKELLDI